MTLQEIKKFDFSNITYRTSRERVRELGKTKNAIFIKRNKNSFYFSSPQTYNKKQRYNIIIEKNNSDIKLHCSCDSFSLQGFKYSAWQNGCGVYKETRPNKKWERYHGKSFLCKHLYLLINKQSEQLKKLNIL